MSVPRPTGDYVQLYRKLNGRFDFKPERVPLKPDELLIGKGLTATEAMELIEEFAKADLGVRK